MAPTEAADRVLDPVEAINASLEHAWTNLSKAYDVTGGLPGLADVFMGADLSRPEQAAQAALISMLQEVMGIVGRFSPWYKQPARAYGLYSMVDPLTRRTNWVLAPEAVQRWREELDRLGGVIRKYGGLIKALLLVDDLMEDLPVNDPCVTARCSCWPPRAINLRKSVLDKAEIVCENCLQPFT